MKVLKRLLGIYQLILSVLGLSFMILLGIMISRADPDDIHWPILICVFLQSGQASYFVY